ncbi:proteoglycan 4-like [Hibiscus syriacus]|uniref:proteoglycan 4-like n=1 Tax=Hibiscus syriacus TaxID=106335 RepID=UPI0019221B20|nr:proteoglycan 4-like [Hibiscus syriacus]
MSNQPAPTRPWFRLVSITRPAPTSTPEPAPALPRSDTIRLAFRPPTRAQPNAAAPPPPADKKPTVPVNADTSSVPNSPVKTVPTTTPAKTAATSSLPSSPAAKPVVTNNTEKVSPAKRAPTATSVASFPTQKPASYVTTTTRMPSPKSSMTKPPTGSPPSPFTIPPFQLKAQAEIDPKKIHAETEQKTTEKPKGWLFGGTRKAASKESEAKGKKYSSDSEDAGMRILTITGDNKGAFMEINQSSHHKNGSQGTPFRLENSNSIEAGDRKMKAKSNSSKTMPMNAFINSNVQGINNSIMYNSSCVCHDPGVHLTLYTKPTVGGFHVE